MPIARQISQAIQRWDRTEECDSWQTPIEVTDPIANLPVYSDGILCQQGPLCQFIARKTGTMRKHWREQHAWIAPINRGGGRKPPGPSAAEQQVQQFTQRVKCQRAFTQGIGSHYIRVRMVGAEATEAETPTVFSDQLFDQIEQAFTERQELPQLIEAGERDEANPWLRRTQWAVYLRGINP
jgi:hypothetical protein